MRQNRSALRLTLGLLTALLAAAPTMAEDVAHPLFKSGKSTFTDFCAHCHGINMMNPGDGLSDLRSWPIDNKTDFVSAVMFGAAEMLAWGDVLYPEEVVAIWVYVVMRGGEALFPGQGVEMTLT